MVVALAVEPVILPTLVAVTAVVSSVIESSILIRSTAAAVVPVIATVSTPVRPKPVTVEPFASNAAASAAAEPVRVVAASTLTRPPASVIVVANLDASRLVSSSVTASFPSPDRRGAKS